MSDNRRFWARIAVLGLALLAVTFLLELTGVTDLGYWFPVTFTVVFTLVWGWLEYRRQR